MGYTHYWYRKKSIRVERFKAIAKDFLKVLPYFGAPLMWESDEPKLPRVDGKLIRFNGVGDDGHETFYFPRVFEKEYNSQKPTKGHWFACCETAQKPYDIAVTVVLIIAKHYLGSQIKVSSDGDVEDWKAARDLAQGKLGYGENFKLEGDS